VISLVRWNVSLLEQVKELRASSTEHAVAAIRKMQERGEL
jgi:hypothetical protein